MELVHQIGPDDTATLILQGAGGGTPPTVMPLTPADSVLRGTFADFALVRPFVRALILAAGGGVELQFLGASGRRPYWDPHRAERAQGVRGSNPTDPTR